MLFGGQGVEAEEDLGLFFLKEVDLESPFFIEDGFFVCPMRRGFILLVFDRSGLVYRAEV